jgi:hypothetical protein
LAEFVPKN